MSLEISKVMGVPIKLHFTLIIILALLSWTLSSGFMPRFYPNLDPVLYWIMGIAGAIVLIVSILLHELAHVIVSLKYGLEVRQIILFVFGGVADIKEETKEYKKEFMGKVVKEYFDNSYKELVNFFVEQKKLSAKELKEIISMIEKGNK